MARNGKLPKAPYALPPSLWHKLDKRILTKSQREALANRKAKELADKPKEQGEAGPSNAQPPTKRQKVETTNNSLQGGPRPGASSASPSKTTKKVLRPRPRIAAATKISLEVFEMIFSELKISIMNNHLPDLPIKPKTPNVEATKMGNQRLTNGEVLTYKRFLVKKQLYDLGKVCQSWRDRVKDVRNGNEVIIIGEDDGHKAFRRPNTWFGQHLSQPLDLTVQTTLSTFVQIIEALSRFQSPVNIGKLTILHSFQPEIAPRELYGAEGLSRDYIDDLLCKIKPRSLHLEWYSGEDILTKSCVNTIARTLKRNHFTELIMEDDKAVKVKSKNFQFPEGWENCWDIAKMISSRMLEVWKREIKDFIFRANHMELVNEIRESVTFGGLRVFEYHITPLPLKTLKRNGVLPERWTSPIPPPGALRSIDHILMWDFRWRPSKWLRKKASADAKERGEVYDWRDKFPLAPIQWTVYAPFDMWKQEKDRKQFKGEGKRIPWKGEKADIIDAMAKFILKKMDNYVRPWDWVDKSEEQMFNEMFEFVIDRKQKKKNRPPRTGYKDFQIDVRGKAKIDENLVKARILENKFKYFADNGQRRIRELNDEMAALNQPESKQKEYNERHIRHWLKLKSDVERRDMIENLRKKYGCKDLYTNMNWTLTHPKYEGVGFKVEPRIL
ncbi:uncharacterized protein I303_107954 [Kwoniella dejecticola CBS 10117]|uniref:Uncharacterized protein n=1 Tax=Kwoniella dejecticola CBS 10117 TaxID=1296121 RepID=A0A1A5ZW46_9TREE|nr:uncharacterized protein I303_07947 [Kwoniella dejecticola CBS 10117]OBR82033.1 hypothetical protein I303_07947 [Kwoniella dejecticola CBS 10117]